MDANKAYCCCNIIPRRKSESHGRSGMLKIVPSLQGVPKVGSSNFMHYNFWSKLFLHEISRRGLFLYQVQVFRISVTGTFCRRCGMKWDTACRTTNEPFWAFLSPGAQDPVQPPNNICLVQAAEKKNILGIHPKKIIIPAPFYSKAFVRLTNLKRTGR